jgi:endonuclease/exonuclease/phosphatase family metal-dependent hydrolase
MSIKQTLFLFLFLSLCPCNSVAERAIDNGSEEQKTIVENISFERGKPRNLKIASWNIQNLGRSKSSEEIYKIAHILRDFDLVAIQEVVAKDPAGAQAVANIADELNRMGFKWDYQISDPTKSPSVYISERYAFLWKTSKLEMLKRAYLDKELETLCFREPFVGIFKTKEQSQAFYVVNYHARKYFDKPEEEIIQFINYNERLNSDKVLLTGDFNLDENHDIWKPFYSKGFKSALKNQKTTLKVKCKNGNYLSHGIDNVYFSSGIKLVEAGSVDLVKTCVNLADTRKLSDHLPIYMEFNFKKN